MKRTMSTLQVGDVFPNNEGSSLTVIHITNSRNIGIKYNDQHGYETTAALTDINNGRVKNPYHPSRFNVGYGGVGHYSTGVKGEHARVYTMWTNMLQRCYSDVYQTNQPSYMGCSVSPAWHNFQHFAHWYVNNPFNYPDYQLDKDIIYPGNKVYSPESCVLVPRVINNQFRVTDNFEANNGYPVGVYSSTSGKRYRAIHATLELGTFDTIKEAHNAYLEYRRGYLRQLANDYCNLVDLRVIYALLELVDGL